ncbi:hypothetical protein [Rosettibacter firmus]|uniref:hypothetical protein n=1 Tax=Rosettibacter firmus TaxID=3111522 RepID=UPI00336C0A34
MSRLISVDEIKDGMILAEAIQNRFGHTLLGANVKLEEKHVRFLKSCGIQTIYIVDDSENGSKKEYDDQALEKAKSILSQRINWKPKNDYEEELIELATQHILEKI